MVKRRWTSEEEMYVKKHYGKKPIEEIAKKINRTPGAVSVRAVSYLKMGRASSHSEFIPAAEIARQLGIDRSAVLLWIKNHGLKAKRMYLTEKQRTVLVEMSVMWKWFKKNLDKWDSSELEDGGLGVEPEWMKKKRQEDILLTRKRRRHWTIKEKEEILNMWIKGNTYQEIADIRGVSFRTIKSMLWLYKKTKLSLCSKQKTI